MKGRLLLTLFACSYLWVYAATASESLQEEIGPVPVDIVATDSGYQLLRGGEPYRVRGAGVDGADIVGLAAQGGNSIRTWSVDAPGRDTQALLDQAHSLGMTVSLCLNIARERHGFDYDDPAAVAKQREAAKEAVLKYRNHPALLTWIIGNELNYDYQNPAVYDAVDEIARMIKKLDPNHPTTTTTAGISQTLLNDIQSRAPNLDFLSVQLYGDLVNLPKYIREYGYTGPYFVTEWGAIGHWEMPQTQWGAPVEQTSSQKADNYLKGYREVIEPYPDQLLGDYVFLWGQKQERTPTWYGMFTPDGAETEVVDVMHYIWRGTWPENRSPRLKRLTLNAQQVMSHVNLTPGKTYTAKVSVKDPDGDPLRYVWSVKAESRARQHGGDFEANIADIPGLISGDGPRIKVSAPERAGAYRLFVYVYDGQGHAAHANFPFRVKPK